MDEQNNENKRPAEQVEKLQMGWKKGLLIALGAIGLIAAAAVLCLFLYGKHLTGLMNFVPGVTRPTLPVTEPVETEPPVTTAPTEPEVTAPTEPDYGKTGKVFNVLIVGQASRDGEEAKLADTIMLATINKMTSTVTVTSFPRDTYTQFPTPYVDVKGKTHTCGKNKINAAYALGWSWGGAADAMMFLDQTITNNFGVEIDANIEVDFDAFENAIDMMNGIPMELNAQEAKYMNKYFKYLGENERAIFEEGKNHLDGWEALVYARMRHADAGDSDFKRIDRQRAVLAALKDKCTRRSIPQLTAMAEELMPYLTTDMTDSEIATLILEIVPLLGNLKLETFQVPIDGTITWVKHYAQDIEQWSMAFDIAKNTEALRAIAEVDHIE